MKHLISLSVFIFLFSSSIKSAITPADSISPVTPNASPEAVELLNYIHSISGNHTLAGQHCQPVYGSLRLSVIHRYMHAYPALYGQDFGFDVPGYIDGINFRQRNIDEIILKHRDGFIITLMWHAVPPTKDEPVSFWEDIQGEVSDEEWDSLITPGTKINERWKSQVDVIAWFLKQLREAHVPVLWRPYHEMNGGWFWWGKKDGEDGYKKLWRMLFDRLVNFHKLNNLIWVYNTNEVKFWVDSHVEYYPGDDVVDILATDVYTEGFSESNYEELLELAGNKPIALGEVGRIPSMDILEDQPRWVWFMQWGDPESGMRDPETMSNAYKSDQVITLEELPWVKIENPKIHSPIIK
ncbi:MAG: glycosyl hydrolase [bacterium]